MYDELYASMSPEERDFLYTNRRDTVVTSLSSKTEPIQHSSLDWMAIYVPYFNRRNQYVKLTSSSYYYKSEDINNYYPMVPTARINSPFDLNQYDDYIHIHFVQTSTNAKIYEYAEMLVNDGIFEKLNFANTLLVQHQKHRVQVLAKPKLIIILTNEFNNKLLNETAAIIPSLFKLDTLLQDEKVMNCCRAVVNKQSIRDYFKNVFDSMANAQKEAFKNNLKALLTMNKRKRLDNVSANITATESNIQSYLNSLDNLYTTLQNYRDQKLGIECTLNDDTDKYNELSNFLQNNKFIKEAKFRKCNLGYGTKDLLELNLEAPITLYEVEPLERMVNNIMDNYGHTGQEMLTAIKEVFTNDKYRLVCTTYVVIDPANTQFEADHRNLRYNFTNYNKMPQPHLTFYNCWGDSRSGIKQALKEDDIIGAIQTMLIAIQNINFTDSTVFRSWIDKLCYDNYLRYLECVIDTEGKWYSLTDIYNLVVERENENTEVQQPELIDELGGIG